MRRVVIAIVILLAVAGGVLAYRAARHSNRAAAELVLSGNVEAHESVVAFRTQGRIVDLPVEEGQAVKAGDLLARIDDADYQQQVRIDQANVQTRQRELALAEAGSRTQEVRGAEQSLADAKADLELRRADLQRYTELYRRDAISAQTRDQADSAFKRAEAVYERAVQSLSQLREGTRKEQIAVSRAAVEAAQRNLGLSQVRESYTQLVSPVTGVVTVRQAEAGEFVSAGTPVVSVADIDHLWIRAYLNEPDLGKLQWGQQVKVHTEAIPGKTFTGTVSFISPEAEFTPKTVQTNKERVALVYRIKVDVFNPQHELKPGMPADILVGKEK